MKSCKYITANCVCLCLKSHTFFRKLPRSYITNVIYTLAGAEFTAWVQERINERNEKLKADKDMIIEMDPEIARIFHASTAVSGKSFIQTLTCSVFVSKSQKVLQAI
jgi:hypothetical protein